MGLTDPKNSIRPSDFVNMVSEMWHDAMSSKNAISGFECTGIYPVDHSKCPLERLEERLLNKYDEWLKAGKPVDTSDDTTEADTPIIQLPELPEQPPRPEEIEFTIQEPTTSKQDQITSIPAPSLHIDIPLLLHPPPPGYKWQYHLCLLPVDTEPIQTCKSFEQCFLDIVKLIEKRPKQSRKWLKISSCVVTDEALVAELEMDAEDRSQKDVDKLRRKDLRCEESGQIRSRM